jgi:hypothetical protein
MCGNKKEAFLGLPNPTPLLEMEILGLEFFWN